MNKPTPKEIRDALEWFDETELKYIEKRFGSHVATHIRTLLAVAKQETP